MNKEAVFALRFVMKDFAKMRKGIEQMNKNLEAMQKNANKASSGMNKLNTSMGKTIRSLGKFALAYFTLSKIISTTFKQANEAIQIDLMAQSANVAADKIGKLGKALRIYGGDAKSAGSAYASLTDIIGGAQHGMGISEDVQRVNAMYGIGFNYGNISQDTLMTEIATSMHRLRQKGDQWGINQIAKAYGLDSSMANFLAEQGANWSSERNKQQWERVSKSETVRLLEAQDNLEKATANLGNALIKYLPELVNGITALVNAINTVIDTFSWGKKAGNEAGDKLFETKKNLGLVPEVKISDKARKEYFKDKMPQEQFLVMEEMRKAHDAVKRGVMSLDEYRALRTEAGLNPTGFIGEKELLQITLVNKSGTNLAVSKTEQNNKNTDIPVSMR